MTRYEKAISLWKQKNIKTSAELSEALNTHSISFAFHSSKIENDRVTYNDTREIFNNDGVVKYTGDLRTLFEIKNAKDAYDFLLDSFELMRPIDESLIKEFQRRLTQNTYDTRRWELGERCGEYKHHDYVTGKNEIGASAEDVSDEMNELLDELANIPNDKALTAAAYFHAKFENIHPFADGNGRTGRIVMNYFLLIHGHPPVIIHEEDRNDYYSALDDWDVNQNLAPLITFLKEQTSKTWEKQIERAEIKNGIDNKNAKG